ncbi:MAG: hypothetical protein LBI03_11780 [Clostridiales bacterium]|jgi:hypothetical protein|nr:hypothetical protein [Clostridiales bacterium]
MKKKSFVSLIFIVVIMLCFLPKASVLSSYKDSNNEYIPENSAYGSFDKGELDNNFKKIRYNDSLIELHYEYSENLDVLPESKRSDSYGTYDVYSDENDDEYLFLSGSDTLCGVTMFDQIKTNVAIDSKISEEDAIEISDKRLETDIPDNSDYIRFSCEYNSFMNVYIIDYYKPLEGYKTDDIITYWVNYDGTIVAFKALNLNRYDNVQLQTNKVGATKVETAKSNINKEISSDIKSDNYNITDSYLSKDADGNIILVEKYTYDIYQGNDVIPTEGECTQKVK